MDRRLLFRAGERIVRDNPAPREYGVDEVRLSVVPENERARTLYRAEGFAETGEIDHGEVVMVRTPS